jgi:hypothetical protein
MSTATVWFDGLATIGEKPFVLSLSKDARIVYKGYVCGV